MIFPSNRGLADEAPMGIWAAVSVPRYSSTIQPGVAVARQGFHLAMATAWPSGSGS
jgi:hypothetical protein